jgi:uncharacterized lipoprotein YmbA
MTRRQIGPLMMLGLTLVALVSCVTGRSPPTTFYLLTPQAEAHTPKEPNGPLVGVGPVEFPPYLDRIQIVTRTASNRIELADLNHWAEPLARNFADVLAEDLSSQIPTERVVVYPWGAAPLAYQVVVEVSRFDASADGTVRLKARWSLYGQDQRDLLIVRQSNITTTLQGEGFESMAIALSEAVSDLGREVAAEIKRQRDKPSGKPNL